MKRIANSVRITDDANQTLNELSQRMGQPKAQVVELALKDLEDRLFWQEVNAAYEKIAADPESAAAQKTEMELWDRTSATDFKDESW